MASAIYKSNDYHGRVIEVKINQTPNVVGNYSTLNWTITSKGGSADYYTIASTALIIDGKNVYSKGKTDWNDRVFPAAKGSRSGSLVVKHNSDGNKTVSISFKTRVYLAGAQEYGGSFKLEKIDRRAPNISFSIVNVTANDFIINAHSDFYCNNWWYKLDDGNWIKYSNTSTKATSVKVSNLKSNKTYTVQVSARRGYNEVDGYSYRENVTTLGGSVLKSVIDFNIDIQDPTFTLNTIVYDKYSHDLTMKYDNKVLFKIDELTLSIGTNSLTINITDEQKNIILEAMQNDSVIRPSFELRTLSGSTQIGNVSIAKCNVKTSIKNSAPIFTDFIHLDINKITTDITEDNQTYIKDNSILRIEANPAIPKNGSIIDHYTITIGNQTKTVSSLPMTFGTIGISGEKSTLVVEAVDSRGYSTSVTKFIQVANYEPISFKNYSIRRENEVGTTAQLSFNGTLSPITINNVNKNQVVITTCSYNDSSNIITFPLNVESTTSSFSFKTKSLSDDKGIIKFNDKKSYKITIEISDKLSENAITLTLEKGIPLIAYREGKIGINNPDPQVALDVKGTIRTNGYDVYAFKGVYKDGTDASQFVESGIYGIIDPNGTKHGFPEDGIGILEVFNIDLGSLNNTIIQRITYDHSTNSPTCYIKNNITHFGAWGKLNITPIKI